MDWQVIEQANGLSAITKVKAMNKQTNNLTEKQKTANLKQRLKLAKQEAKAGKYESADKVFKEISKKPLSSR